MTFAKELVIIVKTVKRLTEGRDKSLTPEYGIFFSKTVKRLTESVERRENEWQIILKWKGCSII